MNIANMKPNDNSVLLSEANLATGVFYKHKNFVNNINFWHKFVVSNTENVPRDIVLRAILDHVHPMDLIPVAFGKDKFNSYFLARNCGAAIEKLCKDNLMVASQDEARPFKLNIILKFTTTSEFKIDVQKNISIVLNKRYDASTKTVNLTTFDKDPELSEFCPLSQPKIMFFILHLSKNLAPPPERYILCENRIKVLNPMEALFKGNITYVDLRNNLIEKVENLSPLKAFKISELLLDGNPLCNQEEYSYIQEVQKYCPAFERLDGFLLKDGSFPTTRTNFLCDPRGFDLVNQFLEYFFTVYDSRNRQHIECLYHKKAMFSLTSTYISGQLSSSTAQLRQYNTIARNLLKLADFSRNTEYLFQGSTIIKIFNQLPPTEHDPYSFKVDLMYYSPLCAVVSVSGVFRELPQNLLDPERLFGFTRTFAIEIMNGDGECCIVNEQLHIYNALSDQVVNSFKVSKPMGLDVIPQAQNPNEQQQLADALRTLTNLNADWAKKCLEECNYDLRKALSLFIDLYKVDKIPLEGYTSTK